MKKITNIECPECGMPKDQWSEGGHKKGNNIYCCRGCAEGEGCACKDKKSKNMEE